MKTAPKKATRIKAGRIQRANYKWIYLFLLPTIVIFAMFYLMPIAQVFVTSFTKWDGFNAPKFNGLTNYINLFTNSSFLIALKNLLWWCVIALTLHVGFGTLVAFVLYQRPHGWKFTRTVFMIPNVISAAAWAMIYKFIFNNDFGILNSVIRVFNPNFNVQWFYKSPWAFWAVTFTWLFYAVIVTLVVLGDLMNIPKELNEAALMDGATGWQLIRYIQLPLCRASIGTSVIASLTSRIAMYEQIALTTSGGPGDDTMSLPIILVKGIMDYRYGYANAVGVVMFIIDLGAYVIAKFEFPGRKLLFALFTITLLVPSHSKTQPIFSLITKLNLYDSIWGVTLVYLSAGMAMSIFVLKAGFMAIPKSLDEAATLDGASFFRTFWTINLPLAKSALATAGILMFLGNWNEYYFASLLTVSDSQRTLPIALAFFTSEFSYNYTQLFAALTIVILPGIILYALAQDQVQASVAASGVKG